MSRKFKIGISRDVITANGTIFGEEAFKVLEDPAVEWEIMPEKLAELPPQYGDTYDAICLLSAKVTRKTLSGANRKVKLIARFGVGYDSVDVAACTDERRHADHHTGRRTPARGGQRDWLRARTCAPHVSEGPADPRRALGREG